MPIHFLRAEVFICAVVRKSEEQEVLCGCTRAKDNHREINVLTSSVSDLTKHCFTVVTVLPPKLACDNILGRAPHNVTVAATLLNSATDRNGADGVLVWCTTVVRPQVY